MLLLAGDEPDDESATNPRNHSSNATIVVTSLQSDNNPHLISIFQLYFPLLQIVGAMIVVILIFLVSIATSPLFPEQKKRNAVQPWLHPENYIQLH